MIPIAASLFHVEEGEAEAGAPRELVGLRLIIESSVAVAAAAERPAAVLRRSAMRPPTAASAPAGFVGLEFLKRCLCYHREMSGDMDVFVYKGEQAFCSAECRGQKMAKEEWREMEAIARRRRAAFHSSSAAPPVPAPARGSSSNWHAGVQTTAY